MREPDSVVCGGEGIVRQRGDDGGGDDDVVLGLPEPPLPPPGDFLPLCFSEPPGSELPPKKSLPKTRSTRAFYGHFCT